MADERDTGEHFIGSPSGERELSVQISARRVADLTTQIEFLDREIGRYREVVERERIRHATEVANLQLATDTQLDELRRDERLAMQAVHESYRSLLNERQIDFEKVLTEAAAASAVALAAERQHSDELLARERSRRDALIEAGRRQAVDEANQAHQRSSQSLHAEVARAATIIEQLQHDLAEQVERTTTAEQRAEKLDGEMAALQHRLESLERSHEAKVGEIEAQLAKATDRIAAERRRSAATLSDLLERSASIAAEADRARSEFAAERAKAAHALASSQQRARDDYTALADAADERASRALLREAELETVIGELRDRLTASEAAPNYCEQGDDSSGSS